MHTHINTHTHIEARVKAKARQQGKRERENIKGGREAGFPFILLVERRQDAQLSVFHLSVSVLTVILLILVFNWDSSVLFSSEKSKTSGGFLSWPTGEMNHFSQRTEETFSTPFRRFYDTVKAVFFMPSPTKYTAHWRMIRKRRPTVMQVVRWQQTFNISCLLSKTGTFCYQLWIPECFLFMLHQLTLVCEEELVRIV